MAPHPSPPPANIQPTCRRYIGQRRASTPRAFALRFVSSGCDNQRGKILELALTRLTASGTPIPLDPSGNEMCLLFIKYGRCRYRKKCRKSHWIPPLPDEEYPLPPPLPQSSPPLVILGDLNGVNTALTNSSEGNSISRDLSGATHKQNGNSLSSTSEMSSWCDQQAREPDIWTTILQPLETSPAHRGECSSLTAEGSARNSDGDLPVMWLPKSLMSKASENHGLSLPRIEPLLSGPHRDFRIMPETARCSDKENVTDFKMKSSNITREEAEAISLNSQCPPNLALEPSGYPSIDLLIKRVCQGKSRFDDVFGKSLKGIDPGSTYKSSVSEQYKKMGAYFNRQAGKLEALRSPRTKAGRKYFKLFKRIHWRTCQSLQEKLTTPPMVYLLTVNLSRVDFNRLCPYIYLLVHKSFSAEPCLSWKPSVFSCLVSDTLIALLEYKNISPTQAEHKLCEYGVRQVRARQCMKHLWSIIAKSSLAKNGVAPEVVKCERDVYRGKVSALDYAFACSIAVGPTKAQSAETEAKPPRITQSVKQGLKAISLREANKGAKKHAKETEMASTGFVASREDDVWRARSPFTSEHENESHGISEGLEDTVELNSLACDTTRVVDQLPEKSVASQEAIPSRTYSSNVLEDAVAVRDNGTARTVVGIGVRERSLVSVPVVRRHGVQSSTVFIPPTIKRRKRSRQFKGFGEKEKADLAKRFRTMINDRSQHQTV